MMTVLVDIAAAVICFAGTCHHALVGNDTPRGEFQLAQYSIQDPRFGGDLLVFKHDGTGVFAVHRVLEVEGQQRLARIRSPHAKHRITITAGCINVEPEVYAALVDCCSESKIVIK
jgi:hypothetical protein